MPSHQRAVNPNLAQWLVQAIVRLLATSALAQGLAILVGGSSRWRGPSFQPALSLPGAPESWGVLLMLAGAATVVASLFAHRIATVVGLYALATWSGFFALTQFKSLSDPAAAPYGGIASASLCVLFVLLASAHKLDKR